MLCLIMGKYMRMCTNPLTEKIQYLLCSGESAFYSILLFVFTFCASTVQMFLDFPRAGTFLSPVQVPVQELERVNGVYSLCRGAGDAPDSLPANLTHIPTIIFNIFNINIRAIICQLVPRLNHPHHRQAERAQNNQGFHSVGNSVTILKLPQIVLCRQQYCILSKSRQVRCSAV